ncbi:MAG: hypothetical protein AAF950_16960 [Pseudomonadota bacterium]
MKNHTIFWTSVVCTFGMLAMVTFYATVDKPKLRLNDDNTLSAADSVVRKAAELGDQYLQAELEDLNRAHAKVVKDGTARIFQRAYDNVPAFLEAHYSVTGQYIELFSDSLLRTVFDEDFETRATAELKNMSALIDADLKISLTRVRDRLGEDLGLNPKDMDILEEVLPLVLNDVHARFGATLAERSAGTIASAGAVIKLAEKTALKTTVKTISKAAVKGVAGTWGGAGTGALMGGAACGPVCAFAGGVVGGIVGWFGTDKIIVELDQILNQDEFKRKLIDVLEKQQEELERSLARKVSDRNDTVFKNILTDVRNIKPWNTL